MAKIEYVVFRNSDGASVDDEIHIVGTEGETLCKGEIYPDEDKFYKTKPKTMKGKKLTLCEECEEKAAEKKTKKAPAKKKK